ncbi:Glycoside hydrolase, family 76 [Cordyceps fumosorosea ARSEF 2679]|uniref:mannan endo-1,6-alpha-mannosidase n=1 Tax=Cordyceps fumosorosea (strain ARSEF 2679) TaxID=1081104 RepID=A0A167U9B2_CORFA|nr:Glycoside hydrolase, family 76 [Cordyceps fumosorosea ARSEF 2679]OAA61353.1 Glycoside hydrolase, family 76 [Cordyceps fumosorosea ARSEF 2679]
MKSITLLPLLASASAAVMMPKDLNVQDVRSIRNVAATIAHDTMAYYQGNTTTNDPKAIGNVNRPYYWWVAGALWGMMIDYYHVTKDPSYNHVVLDALLAKVNIGPDNNYLPPEHADEEGNDDLFFWGNAVLSAAENNFPQPNKDLPSWLDISKNVFAWLESKWDTAHCDGGVFWQILASNPNGLNYKNAISNGGFFQLAARLARATNDDKYVQWAQKIWDWSWDKNLIDHELYRVYDGVDIRDQCTKPNPASYTYLSGIYLYGAAVLANHTGKSEWSDRAEKLLDGASWFFYTDGDSKNVMYEGACEPVDSCFKGNADMTTFKGYLADLMWKSAVMVPSLHSKVAQWLIPTAKAAAQSCQGGTTNTQCGMKWSTGGFDNQANLGPQMNALGAVQGLLINAAPPPMQAGSITRNLDANFPAVDPNRENTSATISPTENSTSEKPASSATETPTPASTPASTTTYKASTSSEPTATSSSAPQPTPTSAPTSDTPSTTGSSPASSNTESFSSASTTLAISTSSVPIQTQATPSSKTSETSATEKSELPTTSCPSCTASESSASDITITLNPTPSCSGPCSSLYSSSPSSHHTISTFFSIPNNQTKPGTGLPSSLTHSIATLPAPTGESVSTTSYANHVCFALAVALGSALVNWLV